MIARWLSQRMELSAPEIHTIYLSGLLHDIGKIGVSESVLCKPGRLDSREFDQIRKHPQIGADILQGIRQMGQVTLGVLGHHECFDGTGYPQGLRGRDIPLNARIVMLADCFDAMISDRVYRPALPLTTVLAEIRRFSGTQFDPDLADLFLHSDVRQLVDQLQSIARENTTLYVPPQPFLN
jgi:HD-GYP domain-containing protein (c-di-GMP phosphodiesterase class II)